MSYTRSAVFALIVLVGYVSSFVVIPPISGAARRIPQAKTIESLNVKSSSSPYCLWVSSAAATCFQVTQLMDECFLSIAKVPPVVAGAFFMLTTK